MNPSLFPIPETDLEQRQRQRSLSAMGYVWILAPIVLLAHRNDPLIAPHARAGTVLFLLSVIAWFLPYVGHALVIMLGIAMVAGYVRAARGEAPFLPETGPHQVPDWERVARVLRATFGRSDQTGPEAAPDQAAPGPVIRGNERAACAYLWIASILVADNARTETETFHARQGLLLFAISLATPLLGDLATAANVAILVTSVAGFLWTLSGKRFTLPVLSSASRALPSPERAYAWLRTRLGIASSVPPDPVPQAPDDKLLGMACYLLLGPVLLLTQRANPFIALHARQGTLLAILLAILYASGTTTYSGPAAVSALLLWGASRAQRAGPQRLPVVADVSDLLLRPFLSHGRPQSNANLPNQP